MKDALAQMSNYIVDRKVLGSNQDEGAILKAIDRDGAILGNTVFMRNKTVDNEQFIKLYYDGIRNFFDLRPTSLKVLMLIISIVKNKPNTDEFILLPEEIMEVLKCGKSSVYRALAELCQNEIIAKGRADCSYYINPMIMFNGDRVSFAMTYINKNHPGYMTTRSHLKGTIDTMKMDRILPEYPTMEEALFNEEYDVRKPKEQQ